jgi:hypothetical protein
VHVSSEHPIREDQEEPVFEEEDTQFVEDDKWIPLCNLFLNLYNYMFKQYLPLLVAEGPIRRTREGGSEWEPIKILLEGDGDSNKTNSASNTRLRLTTQVGQAHVGTGVPLDLGTNKQPSDPKHTNTHSGNLHGLLPVLHRSDRWTESVRPVATAVAQQVFQRASATSLGPGTKTPRKHNLHGKKTLHKAYQNNSRQTKN